MKVALITGGSRGIGRGIVEAFAAADYAVGFTYTQNKAAADELVDRLRGDNRTVTAYQADARDFARAEEVVGQARQELGPISTLVNNAGIKNDTAFHKMTPSLWQEVIDTNLGGTFNYSRLVIGEMIRTGGSIINVSSVSGTVGIPGQVNYSASKAGMIGMTKALAKEMARFSVRVNAIAPGYIDTDMTATIEPEKRQKLYSTIPMRRPGTSKEVASLAVYLASDDAAYVTGQVWIMDGGLT
jgi:3-oxoacyl-[acyl-carrier protein] reductase